MVTNGVGRLAWLRSHREPRDVARRGRGGGRRDRGEGEMDENIISGCRVRLGGDRRGGVCLPRPRSRVEPPVGSRNSWPPGCGAANGRTGRGPRSGAVAADVAAATRARRCAARGPGERHARAAGRRSGVPARVEVVTVRARGAGPRSCRSGLAAAAQAPGNVARGGGVGQVESGCAVVVGVAESVPCVGARASRRAALPRPASPARSGPSRPAGRPRRRLRPAPFPAAGLLITCADRRWQIFQVAPQVPARPGRSPSTRVSGCTQDTPSREADLNAEGVQGQDRACPSAGIGTGSPGTPRGLARGLNRLVAEVAAGDVIGVVVVSPTGWGRITRNQRSSKAGVKDSARALLRGSAVVVRQQSEL